MYENAFYKNEYPFLRKLTNLCGLNDPSNFFSTKALIDDIEVKLYNRLIIKKRSLYKNYNYHFIGTKISLIQKLLTASIGVTFIPYTLSIKEIGILTYSWEDCLYEFTGFLLGYACYDFGFSFITDDTNSSERAIKEQKITLHSILYNSENVKAMLLLSQIYLHERNFEQSKLWLNKASTKNTEYEKNKIFNHITQREYFENKEDIERIRLDIPNPLIEEALKMLIEAFSWRAPEPITTASTTTGGGEPTTSEISEDITWDDADYFPPSYENAESSSSYLNQNVQTNNETIRLRYNRLLSTMAGLGQSARDIPERLNRNNGSTRLQEYNIDGNAESSSSYSNQDVQTNNETSGLQLQYNRFSSTIAGLDQSARDIPERLNRNNETTKFQEYNRFLSNDSE
ncbi:hypothetical protein [unidentified bacterial endosymbiont]|uniref:hypothetical protein n=1 Tax=unidentified bacterial endosymbiont TaxID=2355 RepID=UPI00209E1C59|nr:hypothetical protein [unidentified bacterial endosymbiont]